MMNISTVCSSGQTLSITVCSSGQKLSITSTVLYVLQISYTFPDQISEN